MASVATNAARQAGKAAGEITKGSGKDAILKKGARRDPELYV
jgi:hypothetical protein